MSQIREGVYTLRSVGSNGTLELSDGWWHFGQVTAPQKADGDPQYHQWVVARPPGAGAEEFVLFNPYVASYAGVWKDEYTQGSNLVKCSPSGVSSTNMTWRASKVPSDKDLYTIQWALDPSKGLKLEQGSDNVQAGQGGNHGDRAMQWQFDEVKTTDNKWRDWMSRLPDDIKLHEINLPSTHQSLACHGIDKIRPEPDWNTLGNDQPRPWVRLPLAINNPKCQNVSLWEQLQMGIRCFDIRLDVDRVPVMRRGADGQVHEETKNYLYARHGLAEIGHAWSAVLLMLRTFLRSNPSEFVIANVRYEKALPNSTDRTQDWLQTFVEETRPFWQEDDSVVYKWWQNQAPNMTELSLQDVRGKLILKDEDNYMPADGKQGRHDGARCVPKKMVLAGRYDTPRNEWDKQLHDCEANIEQAKSHGSSQPRVYYQTSFNVSGIPKIAGLSEILHIKSFFTDLFTSDKGGADQGANVFDPIDFFEYFKDKWTRRGDDCPLSGKSLGVNGQFRAGKIDLDFCDLIRPWVVNIIKSNRAKAGQEFVSRNA